MTDEELIAEFRSTLAKLEALERSIQERNITIHWRAYNRAGDYVDGVSFSFQPEATSFMKKL